MSGDGDCVHLRHSGRGYGAFMTASPPRLRAYTDSAVEAILAELNGAVVDQHRLHAWASESAIPLRRTVATPDLTYVRLAGTDTRGGYIVLMLLDGLWERVI